MPARSTAGCRSGRSTRSASCPASTTPSSSCAATRCGSFEPGLMHGDYQFANVMFRHGAPARAGRDRRLRDGHDRRPDARPGVGPDAVAERRRGPSAAKSYVDYDGLPDREDLLEYYATHTGRPVDEIDYYLVLGNFKMAIVLEGGYARMIKGARATTRTPRLRRLRAAVGHQGRRHRPVDPVAQPLSRPTFSAARSAGRRRGGSCPR